MQKWCKIKLGLEFFGGRIIQYMVGCLVIENFHPDLQSRRHKTLC